MKMHRWTILIVFCIPFIFFGCTSNPEEVVKKGVLQFDSSVTVGDALNGYRYFKTTKWEAFEDSQKRQIVEFTGIIDYDTFVGAPGLLRGERLTVDEIKKAKPKIKDLEAKYIAQFAISTDGKSFQVQYSGTNITGLYNGKPINQELVDENFDTFQEIYSNEAESNALSWLHIALMPAN